MLIITMLQPTGNKTSFYYYDKAKSCMSAIIRALESQGLIFINAVYQM